MTILHFLFQRTGMCIDEFYRKSEGVQAFIMASMETQLMEEGRLKRDG